MITLAKILKIKNKVSTVDGSIFENTPIFGCDVYIPIFDGDKLTEETTAFATFAYTPGLTGTYKDGDIVYVAFEERGYGWPVVIGKLFVNKEEISLPGSLSCETLNISSTAKLPENTVFKTTYSIDKDKTFSEEVSISEIVSKLRLIENSSQATQKLYRQKIALASDINEDNMPVYVYTNNSAPLAWDVFTSKDRYVKNVIKVFVQDQNNLENECYIQFDENNQTAAFYNQADNETVAVWEYQMESITVLETVEI